MGSVWDTARMLRDKTGHHTVKVPSQLKEKEQFVCMMEQFVQTICSPAYVSRMQVQSAPLCVENAADAETARQYETAAAVMLTVMIAEKS